MVTMPGWERTPAERASRNSRSRRRARSSALVTSPRRMVLMATGRPMVGSVARLHGDVGEVVLRLHVVDGDDARVGEDAGRAGFAEQPLAQAGALLGVGDFAEDPA